MACYSLHLIQHIFVPLLVGTLFTCISSWHTNSSLSKTLIQEIFIIWETLESRLIWRANHAGKSFCIFTMILENSLTRCFLMARSRPLFVRFVLFNNNFTETEPNSDCWNKGEHYDHLAPFETYCVNETNQQKFFLEWTNLCLYRNIRTRIVGVESE